MIAKNPVLEVMLTGDGSFPHMKNGRILENKLAFSINFKDLSPGTRYFFVYKLKTKEGVELDSNHGYFTTFESKPKKFKFSAMSGSKL